MFCYAEGGRVVATAIFLSPGSVQIGASTTLFSVRASNPLYAFDVTRDGQRFLVMEQPVAGTDSLTLVVNWPAGLKK